MNFFDKTITPLGMGCWPIGGAMYEGKTSYGYSQSNDEESIRTIHAALDGGITLFDTAAAYGAGHSERLLGRALKNRHETVIVTKIGVGIDEASRQLTFGEIDPLSVVPAIEACLARLQRDQIDLLLLHQNGLEVSMAQLIFEAMESARKAGKIAGFGWSTDFSQSVLAMSDWEGFVGVEHAMNVLQDAPRIQKVIEEKRLHALIRSPLAMGLLSGKYDIDTKLPTDDVRANAMSHWASYYLDGRPNPDFLNVQSFLSFRRFLFEFRPAIRFALRTFHRP